MEYQFRPIDRWTFPETRPRRSKWTFKASYGDTLNMLEHELGQLEARNVVLQAVISRSNIRLDGMLRAGAEPMHPGIIVSFESRSAGSLSFPCDSCEMWQHNIRSIALGLAALRAVDRYGVTKRAEQYKGWEALPSPTGEGALWKIPEHVDEARTLVRRFYSLGNGLDDRELLKHAKQGQIQFHPDRPSGDERMSRAFNAAVRWLERVV